MPSLDVHYAHRVARHNMHLSLAALFRKAKPRTLAAMRTRTHRNGARTFGLFPVGVPWWWASLAPGS